MDKYNLDRFVEAQKFAYEFALIEVKQGYKESHWMWYIFPQIHGLGFSYMSETYSIKSREEAIAYMEHPILGNNLIEISNALLHLKNNNAESIFGEIDALKLQSCMTLFGEVCEECDIFHKVLEKYFDGQKDGLTLEILKNM